jgi:hypothetical protein
VLVLLAKLESTFLKRVSRFSCSSFLAGITSLSRLLWGIEVYGSYYFGEYIALKNCVVGVMIGGYERVVP